MAHAWGVGLAVAGLLLTGCGDDAEHAKADEPGAPRTITVTSPAFAEGDAIPERYTCRGKGISPPLAWSAAGDVGSFALVVDDPDAPGGGYVHWVLLGITTDELDEDTVPEGATEVDASGGAGWSPPCPPSGTHHYRFTVYAFPADETTIVETGAPLDAFLRLIADDAVAWGRLTGTVTASGEGDSGGGY